MKPRRRDVQRALGREIRKARLRVGMTRAELAKQAEISPERVISIESGTGNVLTDELLALARVLGEDPAKLLAKILDETR